MKRVRLIFIGDVLVGTLCWILSSGPAPMPALSMRSLGLTGTLWTRTNETGMIETGPRWSFAITNSGPTAASWWAYIQFTDKNIPVVNTLGMDRQLVQGRLASHQEAVYSIAAPSDTNVVWRGTVDYSKAPSLLQSTLWPVGKHVPALRDWFSLGDGVNCDDDWRTTTNVTGVTRTN